MLDKLLKHYKEKEDKLNDKKLINAVVDKRIARLYYVRGIIRALEILIKHGYKL